MHVPFYGRNTGLKKGAVPVEHSDATSLNEEFNAEPAPAARFQGPLPAQCLPAASGMRDCTCRSENLMTPAAPNRAA